MDAMTHAIEGYVSQDWSPHGDARALHALRMIRDNLERAVERGPEDEEARGNMLVAANLAITLALGSVHAMSHPGRRPVRRSARRGERDPPAARDPLQRRGRR